MYSVRGGAWSCYRYILCLAHSRYSQVSLDRTRNPCGSREGNRSRSGREEKGNGRNIPGRGVESGGWGSVGLELWPRKPSMSSREMLGASERNGGGGLPRFRGKGEPGEVTSRKEEGGHSSPCGFQADQEGGLLRGPCKVLPAHNRRGAALLVSCLLPPAWLSGRRNEHPRQGNREAKVLRQE